MRVPYRGKAAYPKAYKTNLSLEGTVEGTSRKSVKTSGVGKRNSGGGYIGKQAWASLKEVVALVKEHKESKEVAAAFMTKATWISNLYLI